MKIKLWKETVIVCISTLCIITMITMNNPQLSEAKEENNKEINALVMKSDEVNIGVVSSEEIGNSAIEKVKEIYLGSSNIDNITSVKLNNEISYENITCSKNDILSEEEISNKIIKYNDSNEKSLVSFTVQKGAQVKEKIQGTKLEDEVAFNIANGSSTELYKEVFLHNSLNTPIRGILTSTFGEQREGYNHKGIDLAANMGTPIEAALDGTVYFSGVANGYGNVVMIKHQNNLETIYAHCNTLNVSTGQNVTRGQVIAEVGNTGDSTGPHLHFEIRVNGSPVDPLQYNGSIQY